MRTLSIFLVCLFLTMPTIGQETDKPYTEMTLEELELINASSLSKTDRKLHNKALKAAQKAEKRRIAAEKKASKARASAEAKRLKAEAKARKKANKRINTQLALFQDTYNNATYRRDDFEAHIGVNAPMHSEDPNFFNFSVVTNDVWYRLRAKAYPAEQRFDLQIYVSKELSISELDQIDVDTMRGPPEKYVSRNGYWRNYNRAVMRGGIERKLTFAERYFDACSESCNFREDYIIHLDYQDFEQALITVQNFKMRISNRTNENFMLIVPPGYILGYLKRLAELDKSYSFLTPLIEQGLAALENHLIK